MASALFDCRPGELTILATRSRCEPCFKKALHWRMPIAPPELPTRGRLKPDFSLLGPVVGFCIAQADENAQFADRKTLTIARILQFLSA